MKYVMDPKQYTKRIPTLVGKFFANYKNNFFA